MCEHFCGFRRAHHGTENCGQKLTPHWDSFRRTVVPTGTDQDSTGRSTVARRHELERPENFLPVSCMP
jgi:hypothetical protein